MGTTLLSLPMGRSPLNIMKLSKLHLALESALLIGFMSLAFANPPKFSSIALPRIALIGPVGTISAVNPTPLAGVSVAGQSVDIILAPIAPAVTVQVTGTWSATLLGQISVDNGQTWTTLTGTPFTAVGATGSWASGTNGAWTISAPGSIFRITCSAYTSGTANVAMWGYAAGSSSGGTSSTVTANAGINLNTSALALETGGNLAKLATGPGSKDTAFGSTVSHNSKASAGTLFTASISSLDTNLIYFQVFNKASGPSGGDTPIFSFPVGAATATAPNYLKIGPDTFTGLGYAFATGISWGISSTNATYTATADSASLFNVTVLFN